MGFVLRNARPRDSGVAHHKQGIAIDGFEEVGRIGDPPRRKKRTHERKRPF